MPGKRHRHPSLLSISLSLARSRFLCVLPARSQCLTFEFSTTFTKRTEFGGFHWGVSAKKLVQITLIILHRFVCLFVAVCFSFPYRIIVLNMVARWMPLATALTALLPPPFNVHSHTRTQNHNDSVLSSLQHIHSTA